MVDNKAHCKAMQKRDWETVLTDFLIVYTFVPLWITLLGFGLNYFHNNYPSLSSIFWQNDFDLMLLPMILLLIGVPATLLRFAASNSEHFLHAFRIQKNDNLPKWQTISGFMSIITKKAAMFGIITCFQLSGYLNTTNEFNFDEYYLTALASLAIFDVWTYWNHRLMHTVPQLYKYHKTHHDIKNTVAISLFQMDIVDFCANHLMAPQMVLALISSLIFGHQLIYNVWVSALLFMLAQTLMIHADFKVSGVRNSLGLVWSQTIEHHSNHHFINKGNYSIVAPQIWDWICNTEYIQKT